MGNIYTLQSIQRVSYSLFTTSDQPRGEKTFDLLQPIRTQMSVWPLEAEPRVCVVLMLLVWFFFTCQEPGLTGDI